MLRASFPLLIRMFVPSLVKSIDPVVLEKSNMWKVYRQSDERTDFADRLRWAKKNLYNLALFFNYMLSHSYTVGMQYTCSLPVSRHALLSALLWQWRCHIGSIFTFDAITSLWSEAVNDLGYQSMYNFQKNTLYFIVNTLSVCIPINMWIFWESIHLCENWLCIPYKTIRKWN